MVVSKNGLSLIRDDSVDRWIPASSAIPADLERSRTGNQSRYSSI
jgi:hypothetical protein